MASNLPKFPLVWAEGWRLPPKTESKGRGSLYPTMLPPEEYFSKIDGERKGGEKKFLETIITE